MQWRSRRWGIAFDTMTLGTTCILVCPPSPRPGAISVCHTEQQRKVAVLNSRKLPLTVPRWEIAECLPPQGDKCQQWTVGESPSHFTQSTTSGTRIFSSVMVTSAAQDTAFYCFKEAKCRGNLGKDVFCQNITATERMGRMDQALRCP